MRLNPEDRAHEPSSSLLEGMSAIFETLGRGVICLSPEFRIVHASSGLDALTAPGTASALEGQEAARALGSELFGDNGSLRRALLSGDRREGWGATLSAPGLQPRQVSVTVAPLPTERLVGCDPRVAYLVVVRPAEGDLDAGPAAPTLFAGLLARSAAMLRVFRLVEQLKESDATVLLTGESGTGKELLARAIHLYSPRANGPFVAVNCAAIPSELLESELFGHVRGAFTGAVRDRQGRFELAQGGTLFLDEVGDLALPLQGKLLRVLQERTYERVGESASRKSDARVIAATHVDLLRSVREGRFREDLFYRLRVVPIEIPPLRERPEDVEPLARHLLARLNARHGRALRLDPTAVKALVSYSWPGNVRELENALEFAVAVAQGQTLHASDLPLTLTPLPAPPRRDTPPPATARQEAEREKLLRALEACRWRRDAAAAELGISRTTLWRKMRELGLEMFQNET